METLSGLAPMFVLKHRFFCGGEKFVSGYGACFDEVNIFM